MKRGQERDSPADGGHRMGYRADSLLGDERDGKRKSRQNGEAEPEFHVVELVRKAAGVAGEGSADFTADRDPTPRHRLAEPKREALSALWAGRTPFAVNNVKQYTLIVAGER